MAPALPSIASLPHGAEVETGGDKEHAGDHRAGSAVVLVREAERTGLARGTVHQGERTEHDAGDTDQGEQREEIPHSFLVSMEIEPAEDPAAADAWMKSPSGPLGK